MAMNKTAAGKYVVDFWYFDEGKRKRRERTFTKKKEATAFYESTRSKVRDNEYTPPSRHSVKEMCEQYLAATKMKTKVQTYLQYKRHVDGYIVPAFGERRMTELGFAEIEEAGRKWGKEKKINPVSVNKIFRTLGAVYSYAKKFGVNYNPMTRVDRQRDNKTLEAIEAEAIRGLTQVDDDGAGDGHLRAVGPHEVYSAEEVKKLIDASKPGLERALHMTAVMTGMRHGELNGLQWDKVDFEKSRIFVSRSLTELKGGAIIERPKSRAAYRYLPVTPMHVSELKRWKLASPVNELDLVFADPVGRALNRKSNNQRLKQAAKRAKVKALTMHNLRHTYASQHLLADTKPIELSQLMGHADPGITLKVYSHWTQKDYTGSAAALESRYFASGTAGE